MTESRPPFPPFDAPDRRARRCRPPRTPGTPATRSGSAWPTPRTPSGATATSSSPAGTRSSRSSPRKWARELDYALRKSLWGFTDDRIAVRFQYECHDAAGQWWRCYGNELWEFDADGLMRRREASINDLAIDASPSGASSARGPRTSAAQRFRSGRSHVPGVRASTW